MLNDVTFGQYYPTKSFVHSMDSRCKLLIVVAYVVFVFLVDNYYGFIVVASLLLLSVLFSRVPIWSIIRSIKTILFLVVFTAILNLLFYGGEGKVLLSVWKLDITDTALHFTAFMILRLTLLVMGTTLLTLTTTPVEITDAIESLLKPLKIIKFPVHELALIMSIALRFIPTLMDETDRIMRAQKSRGVDFERGGLIKRAKAIVPILIPLLISAFRRADELAEAMDARCYRGSRGRTRFKKLKFGYRDLIGSLFCTTLFGLIIFLNVRFGKII